MKNSSIDTLKILQNFPEFKSNKLLTEIISHIASLDDLIFVFISKYDFKIDFMKEALQHLSMDRSFVSRNQMRKLFINYIL